ncbi:MAG TPA: hypothetical protein VFU10_05220 [Gaiellaceae bacterium]|nr:hypothetical protein [Gaiellaceae bacterium]
MTLSPLIGTIGNDIPQVSFGGKIGYHLFVQNTGDSTTQHGRIVVTSDKATFSDASDTTNCAVNPKDAHQMVCTPFGGTFVPGFTFAVDLRFTAPSSGTQVSTVATVSVAAQTVGGGNNNGTTLAQSPPVLTNIVENTTKADTYLHVDENAGTGDLSDTHPQNFSVSMPASFFGDPFGIALSIHDGVGTPLCDTCLTAFTSLDIPTAPFPATPGNPFHNGVDPDQPYGWSINANYPKGFQLTKLVHVDDNGVATDVPSCAGGAPTVAQPLCWDTLDQLKNTKKLVATGRGLENGQFGFG